MNKICTSCGKKFNAERKSRKYCSLFCAKRKKIIYKLICEGCGKEFETNKKHRKYCLVSCAQKEISRRRKTRIGVVCLKCGRKYEIQKYRIKKGKKYFCSNECRKNYNNRLKKKCEICGTEFEFGRTRQTTAKYCSKKCRDKGLSINKKYSERGNKNKDRERALKEYGNKCEICGWDKIVQVHHIDENRENHNLKNLCILCPNHHTLTEEKHKKNKNFISKEKVVNLINNFRKGKENVKKDRKF